MICKWKWQENKPQVENTTNDPVYLSPPCFSLFMVWLYIIRACQVLLCSFLGHFSCPIFSVFLCHTPNLLSVRSKWLCLPVSLLSISFLYSSLHPAAVSLSQLALGLRPGGLFALKDHDGLHHCLHQCWGAAMGLDLCRVLFIQRLHRKWERTYNRWMDDDRVYFLVSHILIYELFLVEGRHLEIN